MKNRFQLCNPRCILVRSKSTLCLPSKLRKSPSRPGYSRVSDPVNPCSLSGSIRLLPSCFPEDSLLVHVLSAFARENSPFLTTSTILSKSGTHSKRKPCLKRKTCGPGRSETAGRTRIRHGINSLPLTEEATFLLADLPPHHKDPFDRMLICQALVHGMTLISSDPKIHKYNLSLL